MKCMKLNTIISGNHLKYLVGLFCIVPVLFSCNQKKSLPVLGKKQTVKRVVKEDTVVDTLYHTIPDFRLMDQDSQMITLSTFEGKVYVADFFFTSCPTMCPKMKKQMYRVYQEFEDNDELVFLSHTVDPARDSVPVLKAYANDLGVKTDKWHFVTGERKKIYNIAEKGYLTFAQKDPQAPGGFSHTGMFILVDRQNRIRGYYNGTRKEEADKLINDLHAFLGDQ